MPRQTSATPMKVIMPDGFRIEASNNSGASWVDLGVIAGGAPITFNWDELQLDGGNYEGFKDETINHTVALAPSALWNFNTDNLAVIFGGIFSSSAATEPNTGKVMEFAGTSKHVSVTRIALRLTHYNVDATAGSETDADIDWRFVLYNAKADAGASFNFKGVNEDGLDEVTVSFTGKPDPAEAYRLFEFFESI